MLAVTVTATFAISGCKKDSPSDAEGNFDRAATAGFSKPTQVIPTDATGKINEDLFLTNDRVWLLDGIVYVTNNAVLEIEPGTVLSSGEFRQYSDQSGNTRDIRGVLVVTKGSQLIARGTQNQPIVFTSPNDPGNRKAGDFGGIILLGDSPTNKPTTQVIEGLPANPPADITYGGNDPADNSGVLEYVRIEFGGFKLFNDNEINGLTCGGVGSGTILRAIQVSFGADDAFEFFGGTVNAAYLIALGTDDDDFDFDFGYRGTITNGIALKSVFGSTHSKSSSDPNASDANGIESDNDAAGSTATPKTKAVLNNFTILGYDLNTTKPDTLKNGARFRRNTSLSVTNSIIAGFPLGVSFESTGTTGSAAAEFSGNVVHGYNAVFSPNPPPSYASGTVIFSGPNADKDIKLGGPASPFYQGASYVIDNLLPSSGSPSTDKGAVRPFNVDKWRNWVGFYPKDTVY